jgi:RNA polymerase sigma factor, sigma-70 family
MIHDDIVIYNVKNGNKEDFGLLVDKYKDKLYSFIFYSVRDEAAAGDIFQETMLKALTEINKYKEEGKFKAWLFTIARNKITDHFRRCAKTVQLDEENEDETFASEDTTSSQAFGKVSMEEITGFISRLPREQQEVIILRQYLSFKEIAAMLGCPLGTVLARMNRGIKKLQKLMGEEYAS